MRCRDGAGIARTAAHAATSRTEHSSDIFVVCRTAETAVSNRRTLLLKAAGKLLTLTAADRE